MIKICPECGKRFTPTGNNQIYCKEPHTTTCIICGKKFTYTYSPKNKPKTCSKECKKKYMEQIVEKKYGNKITSISQVPEIRDKKKISNASKQAQDKRKETCLNKYGTEYACQNLEIINKSKQTRRKHMIEKESQEKENLNTDQIFITDNGIQVDNLYQLIVYNFCLRNNFNFEYKKNIIQCKDEDQSKIIIIDFKIDDILIQCIDKSFIDGTFKYDTDNIPMKTKLEVYSKNDIIVVTDNSCKNKFGRPNGKISNGLKYKNKCPNPLIGIDINLFTENPEFPYDENRPPCFYDVKVNGDKSCKEAFYDETIRWKMIKNRILYSGGFIDGKQILNALNISRTCKQPSSFSKKLAVKIINDYCTSDTIVDPFAGWGDRCDASKELNKTYIGIDYNKELVKWHNEHGRPEISYGDANTFTYNNECSVFICPPYSDPKTGKCFEDYNFEGFDNSAKEKTQCDWLRICMKNIPNANEYIMVCKILDENWKQYIVNTKNNKSHFGTNIEYIIKISNDEAKQILKKSN